MYQARLWITLVGAMVLWAGGLGSPTLAGEEVSEVKRSPGDIPEAVSSTLKREIKGALEEVEEIRYEGITVLYEAEYTQNGEEYEVYVYPNGELAERHKEHDKAEENEAN